MNELISTLRDLVAIDSTSTLPNAPVVDYLERRLARAGFSTERLRYADDAGAEKTNLIARKGSGDPALALVGHTDCVPYDRAWSEALTLTEKDGKLFGRGACDTKAFIACALGAAERSAPGKPLMLIFTADEELGCVGAKKLADANAAHPR